MPLGTRLCGAKCSVLYALSALPLQMPLPPGRARAFEAAGKRAGICGGKAANDSPVSAADRAYMKPSSIVQTSGQLGPKSRQISPPVPWRRPGARGQSHRKKLPTAAEPAEPVLPYNGADGNGADFSYSVPRFRQDNDTAKIQPVKGLRVEILHQQNTTRPLTSWIDVAVS